MAFQLLRDYLDGRDPDTALPALLEEHRARGGVLDGWRTTWDRWGGHRETDGQRHDIKVRESRDLHWERELDSDDFVLVRRDGHFEPMDIVRVDPNPQYRNHGWAEIGVDVNASEVRMPAPPVAAPRAARKKKEKALELAVKAWLKETCPDGKPPAGTKIGKTGDTAADTLIGQFKAKHGPVSDSTMKRALRALREELALDKK